MKTGLRKAALVTLDSFIKNTVDKFLIASPIGIGLKAQVRIIWAQAWKRINLKNVGFIIAR